VKLARTTVLELAPQKGRASEDRRPCRGDDEAGPSATRIQNDAPTPAVPELGSLRDG